MSYSLAMSHPPSEGGSGISEAAPLWGGRSSQIVESMQSHISTCRPFVGIQGPIEALESSFQDFLEQRRTFSRQRLELVSEIGAYTGTVKSKLFCHACSPALVDIR
jgi:hypothetical protein